MDADAGEELGAGEADGQDIGVGVSDRWRLGEYEDRESMNTMMIGGLTGAVRIAPIMGVGGECATIDTVVL